MTFIFPTQTHHWAVLTAVSHAQKIVLYIYNLETILPRTYMYEATLLPLSMCSVNSEFLFYVGIASITQFLNKVFHNCATDSAA